MALKTDQDAYKYAVRLFLPCTTSLIAIDYFVLQLQSRCWCGLKNLIDVPRINDQPKSFCNLNQRSNRYEIQIKEKISRATGNNSAG